MCSVAAIDVALFTHHCIACNLFMPVADWIGSVVPRAVRVTFRHKGSTSRLCLRKNASVCTHIEKVTVRVSNEVFAAPSIRIEAVGETVEGSDPHVFSPFVSQRLRSEYPFETTGGTTPPQV